MLRVTFPKPQRVQASNFAVAAFQRCERSPAAVTTGHGPAATQALGCGPNGGHMARDRQTTPRVGVRDVARLAGVSTQTVSRVVNDSPNLRPETRLRVLDAIARL